MHKILSVPVRCLDSAYEISSVRKYTSVLIPEGSLSKKDVVRNVDDPILRCVLKSVLNDPLHTAPLRSSVEHLNSLVTCDSMVRLGYFLPILKGTRVLKHIYGDVRQAGPTHVVPQRGKAWGI